jgi:hypothetical protein
MWLQSLLHDLMVSQLSSDVLLCDNIGATYLSSNHVFHGIAKHIEVDYHFVGENELHIKNASQIYLSSKDQVVDIFVRPISLPLFWSCRRNLSMYDTILRLKVGVRVSALIMLTYLVSI